MKAILLMVLALGFCGFAGARDEKADPVGTWKCEYGGDGRTCTLTIKKDGDKLTGTMSWPVQKETNVTDLKLKDGNLEFSVVRKATDVDVTFDFKVTIDGDTLKGKGTTEFMGLKQGFDINGKREKKDK